MKDTNSKRTQRTPSEIIAETEAKLERLRIKQAKKDAQSNPEVASLLEAKAALQKEIREDKKILGNGPQSAQARIATHEAWILRLRLPASLRPTATRSRRSTLRSTSESRPS